MEKIYQFVDDIIESRRDDFCAIADDIWDHPETRFREFWSAARLADALEAEGFQLSRHAGGIPNAFIASFGEGKPVIALLGEFDALAGLSQQAHSAEPTYATPGENGHGCGHNLLGTAAFAAAVAAKQWLQQHGGSGTLRFYGCPGEEGGSGKTFMVREGLFDDIDAALTGIRKPGPGCSAPARWPIFRRRGALPEPPPTRQTHRILGVARWTPSR